MTGLMASSVFSLALSLPSGPGPAESARFEMELPAGIPFTSGDRLRVPLFLRLDSPAFKYVAFGVTAGPGAAILFSPSPGIIALPGVDSYVDQLLDVRRFSAGLGDFDFNDPDLVVAAPGGRILLGTVNMAIDVSTKVKEIVLEAGACACTDPGTLVPPILSLGVGEKIEPSSASARLPIGSHDFLRGDPNLDGAVDISDVVRILTDMFHAPEEPDFCPDADDADDNGLWEISDPIYLLSYLYLGGPPPGSPFPVPGPDPTLDGIECRSF